MRLLVHTAYSVCYSTVHVQYKCSSFYICFSKIVQKIAGVWLTDRSIQEELPQIKSISLAKTNLKQLKTEMCVNGAAIRKKN